MSEPGIDEVRAAVDQAVAGAQFTPAGSVVIPATEWVRLVSLFFPSRTWPDSAAGREHRGET